MAKRIEIVGLRKEFPLKGQQVVAVDDIDLEIPEGSFTTIVGPSGCGKTTTLRMLAGLEEPTDGDVLFGDRTVTDLPPQDRNVEMVFQHIALYPHMTVRQNIGFGLKLKGVPKEERDPRIEEAARLMQIADHLEKMPGELSGGQQQRVALGSVFVEDPDVLLLDEPMSDLDAKLKAELRVELQRLHKRLDATTVYVTHDQTEAMTMSDYVVLLDEGTIAQFDTPMRLFDRPQSAYVARFIGTPSCNMFECDVLREESGLTVSGDGLRMRVPADALPDESDGAVTVGVRPQYLSLDGGDVEVDATVDVVEHLGTESVVHARTTDGTRMDVITDIRDDLAEDDEITATFDLEDAYVFDSDGNAIAFGDSPEGIEPTRR